MANRDYYEALEDQILAPYAVKSRTSQGRSFAEPPCPNRTAFQRDRDRIIHAKAFRRLKHKTQVFISTDSDHYRTRLTHTLEVAQLSRHIARMLRLNEDLAECIALSHDLGHPPFGHSGERELNQLMERFGGFEHNIQSLRVVEVLEHRYPDFLGLNVSFEVKEGLKKHSKDSWKSLEAQVVNIADQIAYNNHDLDDGLSAGILEQNDLDQHVQLWRQVQSGIQTQYSTLSIQHLRTLVNSRLITLQLSDVVQTTAENIQKQGIKTQEDIQACSVPLVSFSQQMHPLNLELRRYLFTQMYSHPAIYRMNKKGQLMIRGLFETFVSDPKLLPTHYQAKLSTETCKERVVADYIAGMTDGFALKEYQSIFS